MLQSEFGQHKELAVEDLSVNHKLEVVLLDHVFDPIGHCVLDPTIVNLLDLLLSFISSLLHHFANIALGLSLIDEHVSRLTI